MNQWKSGEVEDLDLLASPINLLGLPPVVKAQHHGERGGRQHLLVVVLVQAVSRCQGKSVSNLRGRNFEQRNLLKQSESMIF